MSIFCVAKLWYESVVIRYRAMQYLQSLLIYGFIQDLTDMSEIFLIQKNWATGTAGIYFFTAVCVWWDSGFLLAWVPGWDSIFVVGGGDINKDKNAWLVSGCLLDVWYSARPLTTPVMGDAMGTESTIPAGLGTTYKIVPHLCQSWPAPA